MKNLLCQKFIGVNNKDLGEPYTCSLRALRESVQRLGWSWSLSVMWRLYQCIYYGEHYQDIFLYSRPSSKVLPVADKSTRVSVTTVCLFNLIIREINIWLLKEDKHLYLFPSRIALWFLLPTFFFDVKNCLNSMFLFKKGIMFDLMVVFIELWRVKSHSGVKTF